MNHFITPGKMHILMDGQFGSTGKGLAAGYIAMNQPPIHLAVSNAAPNAGHTVNFGDARGDMVTRHLPVTMLYNKFTQAYLCAGAIIDIDLLVEECKQLNVAPSRVTIHPRAAIIRPEDKKAEAGGLESTVHLASTQKGVGEALARKIKRVNVDATADGNREGLELLGFNVREMDIEAHLKTGLHVLMEVPQGFDLSINSGLAYPHCTSREITVAQALSDAGLHPHFLGNVLVTMRTFPIRVGNVYDDAGKLLGWSGPFHPDQTELKWDAVGVEPEETTVTKRKRRIATFSYRQLDRCIKANRPTHLFLNFCQYCRDADELLSLIRGMPMKPSIFGFGPCSATDVLDPGHRSFEHAVREAFEKYKK